MRPDPVDLLDKSAERAVTPCGEGEMVWRIWGEGPPLVLLHGGFGSWTHWLKVIPTLAERYTLYAPDLPGLGDSAMPPQPGGAAEIARAVSDGLDAIVSAPYKLVGFSFGGIMGGCALVHQKDRAERFVIVGSNGMGFGSLRIEGLRKWDAGTPLDELNEIHRNNLEKIMIYDPDRIDDLAIRLQRENTAKARVKGRDIALSSVLLDALPDIKADVSTLWAMQDAYTKDTREERIQVMQKIRPELRQRFVENCGHWAMYEKPEVFCLRIVELLDGDD